MGDYSSRSLIIGGSSGIGLALSIQLSKQCDSLTIVDKTETEIALPANVKFIKHNLLDSDISFLDTIGDIDILIITAGFGRIAPFETFDLKEIENVFSVNTVALTKIIRYYFPKMLGQNVFHCVVMGSISGLISSPMISLYGASKAAICSLTESLNIELEAAGSHNRILNVSPGSIKGTRFNGNTQTDLDATKKLAEDIIEQMLSNKTIFIPEYDTIYKEVLEKYHNNPHDFGMSSFQYKKDSGRINIKPQLKVGYLSGTFDLFHIGHLNMLRRAKEYCDYLVVGVHKDASHKGKQTFIPFEERCEIVQHIKYVDKVIQSESEDDDVYKKGIVKYDFLFVGSDYKGSDRFNKYEAFFADKRVKIIYFPYTKGTSSTQLREALDMVKIHQE